MKQCRRCNNFFPDEMSICPLDNVELTKSEDNFVGKIVAGCYRVLSKIARGGMGTVYLAKHMYLERNVAVKILKPSISGDEESRKRIVREAKICATLEHPNIVKVYDLATLNGSICLVMELLEGVTLKDLLLREGALNVDRAVKIMSMLAEALARAHSFNIVHRDIKPGNIFMTRYRGVQDFVKLLDFGIAFTIGGSRLTKEGMLVGTPPYISPEQISGKEPYESSDIYSLGCVVYEMLSGKSPFAATKLEDIIRGHLFSEPEPITAVRPDVPGKLDAVIMRMLHKDPGERYVDAFDLLDDMQASGINIYDTETDAMRRTSDHPMPDHRGSTEIEWSKYLNKLAGDIDEDTTRTREFRQGLEAAKELIQIEEKIKNLVTEMENVDRKRREYQQNIGSAVDSLELDLSKIRRGLGKDRMDYLGLVSEREHLVEKARAAETELSMYAGRQSASPRDSVDEKEIGLLIEVGNIGNKLAKILKEEKEIKNEREEFKAQVEDLKFQISQLNKRYYDVKKEFSVKYENLRGMLDEISARGESLRKLAAMAAYKIHQGEPARKEGKEQQQ